MLTSIITLLIVTLAAVLAQEPTVTYPGNNTVVGVAVSGGVNVYRKIPFARPPVGSLRLKAPIYLNDTNQFYNGTQYAPECIQSVNAGSEDCLYLAVYVPPGATNTSKLPVRHWIYGGSYTSGDYYSDGYYDGTALAAQTNTIVVASNYRVGILGFFVSTTTINSSSTGNYGLLDQQTALRWTHENIAAFGGDPNNVTIFGESAGGSSVNFQLLMNGSWPYFRRAIIESGGPWNFRTIKQLTALNDYLLNSLGLSNCDLACLQGLSVDLLANIPAVPFGQPVIDGTLITDQPLNLWRAGKFKPNVELIIGINANEGTTLGSGSYAATANMTAQGVFQSLNLAYNVDPTYANQLAAAYGFPQRWPVSPNVNTDSVYPVWANFIGDYFIKCGNLGLAEFAVANNASVFTYYFYYNNNTRLGTYHSYEIAFVWNNTKFFDGGDTDGLVSQIFVDHFESFQNTGSPGADWQPYSQGNNNTFYIGGVSPFSGPFPRLATCDLIMPLLMNTYTPVTATGTGGTSSASATATGFTNSVTSNNPPTNSNDGARLTFALFSIVVFVSLLV